MFTATAAASPWPARAAYFSAAIFTAASAATNVQYGWARGSDLASSLIWSAIAGAVAIVFALSWPALVRSLEARRWSSAVVALVALLLTGSYSVAAALGSAGGSRANATAAEIAVGDARRRAQDAYDSARTELATLKPTRSAAELEAAIARNPEAGGRCAFVNGSMRTWCPPHPLAPELARAKRRAELEARAERANAELSAVRPAKQANSDARTLARYLQALGVDITDERLNDLLVLLSVLMIEAGGGLSLALGMALQAAPRSSACPSPGHAERQPERILDAGVRIGETVRPTVSADCPRTTRGSAVTEWLALQGGRANTSVRRLASALGRSPSSVHDELRRLAACGAITMTSGARGTVLALRAN